MVLIRQRGYGRARSAVLGGVLACLAATLWGCSAWAPAREPIQQGVAAEESAPPPRSESYQDEVVLFGSMPPVIQVNKNAFPPTPQIQHTWMIEGGDFDPCIDPTGERLVFASTRHAVQPDLYLKSVDGATVTQLTADAAGDINPAFDPEGKRIAFASDRSGNWDIWMLDLKDRRVSQITHGPATELHPSWSPDGRQVAYCSQSPKSGEWELWLVNLEKEGPVRFVGYGMYPQWSPVGNTLLFQRPRRRGEPLFSVWMMKLVNGEPGYATELIAGAATGMILPCWSPDGRHVAFCTVELGGEMVADEGRPRSNRSDIWVVDREGRGRVRITDGVGTSFSPTWSPDGRIYFSSTRAGPENLWSVMPHLLDASGPTRVTRAGLVEMGHREGG